MYSAAKTYQVTEEVTFVSGWGSNWVIYHPSKAEGFLLIDTGYPKDWRNLLQSIRISQLNPAACQGILLTHAHTDHAGNAALYQETYGTSVWCSQGEVENLKGISREQVTIQEILPTLYKPSVFSWIIRAVRAGGLDYRPVENPQTFSGGFLPSTYQVEVISTPGHTSGHTVFLIHSEGKKILVSGDALVTGHQLLEKEGAPQNLPDMFHADVAGSRKSFSELSQLYVDVLLPGHGMFIAD